jgi:hypothetical protein
VKGRRIADVLLVRDGGDNGVAASGQDRSKGLEGAGVHKAVSGRIYLVQEINPQKWKLHLRQPKDPSEAAAKKGKINHLFTLTGNIFS